METRANYLLIGVFTLLAILGTLGFFIWLASVQIDRQYNTYGILFEDVSGLNASGDVQFNGISVGKVIGLKIYDKDPAQVLATIEVDSTTPVRSDTVAQLKSQGVTGVAYISLSGGTPAAAPLVAVDDALPIIPSRRSTVQALVDDAPDLVAEATALLAQFKELTGPSAQSHVANILRNLDTSSARLDEALNDFSEISGTVRDATVQITVFTDQLGEIGANLSETLKLADSTLIAAQEALTSADTAVTSAVAPIEGAERVIAQIEGLMQDRIPTMLDQVSQAVTQANAAIADLQNRTGVTIDAYGETADLLNARLAGLEQTLVDANAAFVALTTASDNFDALVVGDGTLLVSDAREVLADTKSALAVLEAVVVDDVPAIVTDIKSAVSTATAAIDKVAADLTGLTGRFDPLATEAQATLTSATAVLERARTSLEVFDTTLSGSQGALTSAETAFDAATDLMNTDLEPVLNDLRTASARISAAVDDVSRDFPAITSDLRALIARTDSVVAQVQGAVSATAPGISDFTNSGLPELTRLGAEARGLIGTLNDLARRIERDPARFLLDDRVPDYRR